MPRLEESIKDRIAAANANASPDDDHLDDIIDSLADDDDDVGDGELEFGEIDGDAGESDEPTPSWEQTEVDDEEEEPAETAGEVSTDDTETPEAPEETVVAEESPARDTLAAIGYDVSGLTEAQAVRQLSQEFAGLARQQLASRNAPPAPMPSATQPAAPPPAPEVKKPKVDVAALLSELSGAVESEPENDPAWRGYIASGQIRFDGQYYSPIAGAPAYLGGISDKLNKHRDWETKTQATAYRLPEKLKQLTEAVAEMSSTRQGLSIDEVEVHFKEKQAAAADEQFALGVVDRCKNWMFQHSKPSKPGEEARILIHPIHKTPMLTKQGMMYYNELSNLAKAGITDSRLQHYYAISALGKSIDTETPNGQTTNTDGKQGLASSAAKTGTPAAGTKPAKSAAEKRIDLLKTQRQRASKTVNVVSSGQTAEGTGRNGKPPSLGEMLQRAYQANGITKGTRPSEEDDE